MKSLLSKQYRTALLFLGLLGSLSCNKKVEIVVVEEREAANHNTALTIEQARAAIVTMLDSPKPLDNDGSVDRTDQARLKSTVEKLRVSQAERLGKLVVIENWTIDLAEMRFTKPMSSTPNAPSTLTGVFILAPDNVWRAKILGIVYH